MDNLRDGFQIDFIRSHQPSNGFRISHDFMDPLLLPNNSYHPCNSTISPQSSSSPSSESESSPESHDTSNLILKYISEMLMTEEDLDSKPCMLQHCLALQAAEKPFYEVLGQKYPPSPNQLCTPSVRQNAENPDDDFSHSFSSDCTIGYQKTSLFEPPLENHLVPSSFRAMQSVNPEKNWNSITSNESREKKNHQREDSDDSPSEERNNKYSAVYGDDDEPPEMFDEVLLCHSQNHESVSRATTKESLESEGNNKLQSNKQSKGSSNGKKTRSRKKDNNKEVIDLWTLLTHCAQAVASYDQRNAKEHLKQIRQHSSPFGDGTQRLAHYLANGLETRLSAGTPLYMPLAGKENSAAQILKAYQVFITACPFKRMTNFFANRTILKLAEKATKLHIIDFGILYGYQWPCLIQRLSVRPNGPPRLRITGIELPQPGFRPAERVEETRRRLENYCRRFDVPFECNVIAQKWETIQFEDLKVERDEMVVVNCMHRLNYIPDETVVPNSPRDTVLKLIKKINPDLFVHGVGNGTYNAPFFDSRFRETLFHFSSLFDMFEATVPREDEYRVLFEKEVFGRDIMNVIACEGLARVDRPETYKQWQVRNKRAGFKQIPLDQELFKKVKNMVKKEYHEDFVVDQVSHWMLLGWKGRILNALSCWVPA